MSGIKFELDAAFSYGIQIKDDPRLNEGSIILLEPARDGGIAVPATLRNYAADAFEAISGDRVDDVVVTNALTGVPGCLAELTAKGGLHGIMTTSALGTHSTRVRLAGTTPVEVLEYLIANPDHDYYMGVMGRVTRNTSVASYSTVTLAGISPNADYIAGTSSNWGFGVVQALSSGNIAGSPTPAQGHYINRRIDANQPYFADIGVRGHELETLATIQSQGRGELFTMGERVNTDNLAGWPSHILYALWIEDLTVSGRTYAQASAQGMEMYNQRFGPGGQYAGDSWTNPSSVT